MKHLIRDAVRDLKRRMPTRHPGIVVASYGRSGSTLLHRALFEAMCAARFGARRNFVADERWTLAGRPLRRGVVYKTHDYPDALRGQAGIRSLFVFGPASEAVLSVLGQEAARGRGWVDQHLDHLKAPGAYADILEADVLGIGAQLAAWATFDGSPVLCIRYEALWDAAGRIRGFTGLPLRLPERQPRAEKAVPAEVAEAVARTYGPLDARLAALPDVFEAGPEMRALASPGGGQGPR